MGEFTIRLSHINSYTCILIFIALAFKILMIQLEHSLLPVFTWYNYTDQECFFSRRSKQPRNGNDHPTPLTAIHVLE